MKKLCLILTFFALLPLFNYAQHYSDMVLKISPNHRFFTNAEGEPFFWLGETGWLLFSKLNRQETIQYLDKRKEQGYNVIQAMVLHGLDAKNAYGDAALENGNAAMPLITPGADTSDPAQYDYWDHVDFVVDEAAKRDIFMGLVPVWGTNVKNGLVSRDQAKTYATFLANRYGSKPNIVWLNGGDIKGSDSSATWNIIGSTIKSIDSTHLQTFHPFGRTTSSQWFHNAKWLDFNMFQSGHRSYDLDTSIGEHRFGPDNYRFLEIDYNKKPVKPSVDGEPSYEQIPYGLHDTTKPYWNADDVRRYAYWSVFAGAAGHTYGHNSVMQMHRPSDKNSAYGAKSYWYQAINDSGANQMIHLKNLMLSFPYFDRVPDQSMVVKPVGNKYNYIAATRGKGYALFYDYTGRTFKANMGKIEGDKVKATWYSPRDGSRQSIGTMPNRGVAGFDPPGEPREGNDWVLILESVNE